MNKYSTLGQECDEVESGTPNFEPVSNSFQGNGCWSVCLQSSIVQSQYPAVISCVTKGLMPPERLLNKDKPYILHLSGKLPMKDKSGVSKQSIQDMITRASFSSQFEGSKLDNLCKEDLSQNLADILYSQVNVNLRHSAGFQSWAQRWFIGIRESFSQDIRAYQITEDRAKQRYFGWALSGVLKFNHVQGAKLVRGADLLKFDTTITVQIVIINVADLNRLVTTAEKLLDRDIEKLFLTDDCKKINY